MVLDLGSLRLFHQGVVNSQYCRGRRKIHIRQVSVYLTRHRGLELLPQTPYLKMYRNNGIRRGPRNQNSDSTIGSRGLGVVHGSHDARSPHLEWSMATRPVGIVLASAAVRSITISMKVSGCPNTRAHTSQRS